jgi:hypothetical protein
MQWLQDALPAFFGPSQVRHRYEWKTALSNTFSAPAASAHGRLLTLDDLAHRRMPAGICRGAKCLLRCGTLARPVNVRHFTGQRLMQVHPVAQDQLLQFFKSGEAMFADPGAFAAHCRLAAVCY